jgi:hypothetical protein
MGLLRGIVAGVGLGVVVLASAGCASAAPRPQTPLDEQFVQVWPDNPSATAWFASGGYHLYARTPAHFVAIRAPIADVPHDVLVSGSFHKVGGPPGGGYGLIFGDQGVGAGDGIDQGGQFVVAEVGDRGQVGIWRRDGLRWTDIVPWTPTSAVRTDTGTNDLTIQLVGDRVVFQVNGIRVADFTAADVPRVGGVGIFTGGDLNQVAVEHFQVQQVERLMTPTQSVNPRSTLATRPASPPAALPPAAPPRLSPAKPGVSASGLQRVAELLGSIANDIEAIYASFADGIDSAHSPVNDPAALRQAKARFDSAAHTATDLATELDKMGIHPGGADGGH